jgi:hypothetical protein
MIRRQYGKQLALKGDKGKLDLHRVLSVPEEIRQPIYMGRVLSSGGASDFLTFVRSGISENYDLLKGGFSLESSKIKLPKSQRVTDIKPSELKDAERALRAFGQGRESSGKGCLLVGKKGTGKSTLAYYVGRNLDRDGVVCCIGVDYTFVMDYSLHSRLAPLVESFEEFCDRAEEARIAGSPQTIVFMAHSVVQSLIDESEYGAIKGISAEAQSVIMSECDRGFIAHLYAYYKHGGRSPEEVCGDTTPYHEFIIDAEEWYEQLRHKPVELFLKYFNFLLQRGTRDSLEAYTYKAIIRYLLTVSEHEAEALKSMKAILSRSDTKWAFHSTMNLSRRDVLSRCIELPLTQLKQIVSKVLEDVSKNLPILLLLDNLDQKGSELLETRGIYGAIQVFQDLQRTFLNVRTVVAMRDKTLASHEWLPVSDALKGWQEVFLLAPDLRSVLKKRCHTWQQRGTRIGASGYRESMSVVNMILGMAKTVKKSADETGVSSLLEIIEHRHPFNVRGQLRDVARCCQNVLLHKAWVKSRKAEKREVFWSEEKSYEFFMRVFLLGEHRYFSEGLCGYPNVYDNGIPSSPFNACIRSWVMAYLEGGHAVSEEELILRHTELGIPEKDVKAAIDALYRFRILFKGPQIDDYQLSIWGQYFLSNVARDLPYISTIWWTTHIQETYALGEPRELLAHELRKCATNFLRWLDFEEKMALSKLTERPSWIPEIFKDTSWTVHYSLRRIERSLPWYSSGGGIK